jgi:hypothetical protein
METVNRTVYAAHLQTCKLLNKPFTVLENSTLNQKFNVYPEEQPAVNAYPSLCGITIGNKGATYDIGQGNYVLTTPIPHLARHASLYNHIPFVVRHISNDLTPAERLMYRLRVPLQIGGEKYFAYYMRVLDLNTVVPTVELRNVSDGVITNTPFTPEQSDLAPVHPVITNNGLNTTDGDYLVSTAKMVFTLNQQDIVNIREACQILYGDPRYAVINEIGICTGIDKIVSGQLGATTINYTESVVTQLAAFLSQYHALTASTAEVKIGLNVGSVEALIV